ASRSQALRGLCKTRDPTARGIFHCCSCVRLPRKGRTRPRRACPGGALILHYGRRRTFAVRRPHRACPGGALICHYRGKRGAAVCFHPRQPNTDGTSTPTVQGIHAAQVHPIVKSHRSTGTSPAGASKNGVERDDWCFMRSFKSLSSAA